jgi:hypothetical protein
LINILRVGPSLGSRDVVTFVNDDSPTVLDPVRVWRAAPETHQDGALVAPQAIVHPPLEINAEIGAHLKIGNDITLAYHLIVAGIAFRAGVYRTEREVCGLKADG